VYVVVASCLDKYYYGSKTIFHKNCFVKCFEASKF
jgi:hypothetical protein